MPVGSGIVREYKVFVFDEPDRFLRVAVSGNWKGQWYNETRHTRGGPRTSDTKCPVYSGGLNRF